MLQPAMLTDVLCCFVHSCCGVLFLFSCGDSTLLSSFPFHVIPSDQGVPMEAHPAKLIGSRGSEGRYFDFDKLAEVRDKWGRWAKTGYLLS